MEKANYNSMMEMMIDISKAGGTKAATCVWYIKDSIPDTVNACALFMCGFGEVWMDNLPTSGYLHSRVDNDLLNNRLYVLKHLPVDYPRSVFWQKDKEILYVDLENMSQYKCTILSFENCGYYCIFKVQLEGEESPRELQVSEYGVSWIFLDPET